MKTEPLLIGGRSLEEKAFRRVFDASYWDAASKLPRGLYGVRGTKLIRCDCSSGAFCNLLRHTITPGSVLRMRQLFYRTHAELFITTTDLQSFVTRLAVPFELTRFEPSDIVFPLSSGSGALVFREDRVFSSSIFMTEDFAVQLLKRLFPETHEAAEAKHVYNLDATLRYSLRFDYQL